MPYAVLIFISLLIAAMPACAQDTMFHGYPCTQDCSGHKAGYAWAQRKNIFDRADCGGKSQSFTEGCQAAVDELSLNPADIEPAAGGDEDAPNHDAQPGISDDPFADKPFMQDPFAPDALPGMGGGGF